MLFVKSGNEINKKPDNKEERERNKMSNKPISRWKFSETNGKRRPERENKEEYIAEKEENGFFFTEAGHIESRKIIWYNSLYVKDKSLFFHHQGSLGRGWKICI